MQNPKEPNILIVDDNLFNLKVTTSILKDEGYKIGLAQSGIDALKQLEVQIPDLILLDIMMPEMDGIETCRRIKSQSKWREIPIVFLTARTQTDDLVKAFKAGGIDYITKPFQHEELIARVKTHIELYHSKMKINEMIQTRDKLYSIIAHDIKAPFHNIKFTISALKDNYIKPDSREFREVIDHLDASTNDTYDLLDNLLTWTRYQGGIIKLDHNKTDLNILVLETVQVLKPVAENKNITIDLNLFDKCYINVDEATTKTVIRNLLSNAIKFSPEEGIIRVVTRKQNGSLILSVIDQGIGMSEEVIEKIFVQNESYTSNGTNQEKGTGLGFQLIKDFIKLNNGSLKVDSRPKQGTAISVSYPNNLN